MSAAWHPNRWWDWCMSEDEREDPIFNEDLQMYVSQVYKMGILKHFAP